MQTLKKLLALLCFATLATPAHADLIKQNTTYTRTVLMTSSTDHITGATGQTLVIKIAKAGGTPTAITDTVTEQGAGRYAITLVAADTSAIGALDLIITSSGADPTDTHDQVVGFDPSSDLGAATLTSVSAKTGLIATNAMDSPNEVASQANASTLLLSLATYQSVLTTGSTSSVLSTALVGTADLTGSKVVFTTGINKGVTRTITAMNSGTGAITLLTTTPSTPGATDAFSVVQGSKALEQFLAALGTDSKPFLTATDTQAQTEAVAALVAQGYTITRSAKIDNADVATSSRMATFVYTAPPSLPGDYLNAGEIAKLAFLDATISSRSTYAGGAVASVTGSVGSVTGSVGSVAGSVASVTGSVGSVTGSVGSVTGPVTLPATAPTGYGGTAPTVAQIAAVILGNPANLLVTDSTGKVGVNNLPSTVVASNLPTDYQQRTVAVTLPTTAPAGYGGSIGDTPGTTTLLAKIGTPAGTSLAADIAAVKTDTASLVTGVAALPAAVWAFTASDGLTHQQSDALKTVILARGFSVSYNAATRTQVTTYFKADGVTVLATTTVVYDTTGRAMNRTTAFTNLP